MFEVYTCTTIQLSHVFNNVHKATESNISSYTRICKIEKTNILKERPERQNVAGWV
jgi:hypothetical protein